MIDKKLEQRIQDEICNEMRFPSAQTRCVDNRSFMAGAQFVIDLLKTAECLIWRRAGEIENYSKQGGSCALILARRYLKFSGMEYKFINLNDMDDFQMGVFIGADYDWAVLPDKPADHREERERMQEERHRKWVMEREALNHFLWPQLKVATAADCYPITEYRPGEEGVKK